ncbi:MAG: hypothetical protein M3R24_03775 [Chloroflexota bacterium]|nr:hypothetical protein [Chloroflexota bacterium]PLS77640.1 MAG: hypothetical protein CYG59_22745 [Chloroflexota bacterium]
MAMFLRVDSKVINMDLVFEIDDYGDRMRVFYAVSSSDTNGVQQPAYAELRGTSADALRNWLAHNAADIGSSTSED